MPAGRPLPPLVTTGGVVGTSAGNRNTMAAAMLVANPAADAKRVPTWPVDSTPADVNRPSSVNANFRP